MLNPATNKPKDKFNVFTRYLKDQLDKGVEVKVELRDGRVVELEWFTEEGPEYEYFCYRQNGCFLIWENDGISVTSSDFDIMGSID